MQRAEEEGLKSIRNKRKDAEGTTHIARKKVLRVRGKDFSIKRAWKKIGLDFFGFMFFRFPGFPGFPGFESNFLMLLFFEIWSSNLVRSEQTK
jgi:hypothetical protein